MAKAPLDEPQNERAAVTLTKSEKDALRLVSTVEGVSESSLLRDRTVATIVSRAEAIRDKLASTEVA